MSDQFDAALKKLTPEDQQALKERYYQEFLHPLSLENRVRFLQDQMPHVWSRIVLLEFLQRLQQERGGHFEESVAFIHASTAQGGVAFNVKTVGQIDYFGHVIYIETYQHEDVEPGVVVLPLDTILWVGVTDEPLNKGEMGFGNARDLDRNKPMDTRRLAGLPVDGEGSPESEKGGDAKAPDAAVEEATEEAERTAEEGAAQPADDTSSTEEAPPKPSE